MGMKRHKAKLENKYSIRSVDVDCEMFLVTL